MDVGDKSCQSSVRQLQPNWLDAGPADGLDFNLGIDTNPCSVSDRDTPQGRPVSLLQQLAPTEPCKMTPDSFPEADFSLMDTPKQSRHLDPFTNNGKPKDSDTWALSTEESMDGLIMLLDQSGRITVVSKAFHHTLGFYMQEILGADIHDIMHPDDKAHFQASLSRLVATQDSALCHYRLQSTERSYVDLESVCQILTSNGTPAMHEFGTSSQYAILLISRIRDTAHSLKRQLQTQNHLIHSLQQHITELQSIQNEKERQAPNSLGECSQTRRGSAIGDGVRSDEWPTNCLSENLNPDLRPLARNSSQISERGEEIAPSRDFNRAAWTQSNRTVGRSRMSHPGRGRNIEVHVCYACGVSDTPEWRRGPMGSKTLCNACGLKWSKRVNREQN